MIKKNLLYKLLSSNSNAYQKLSIDKKFNNLIGGLDENSIVLDIGANIGNVSNFILEKRKSKVFAFEPNKLCCEIMKRRFVDDSRITIYNLAISNFSGASNFYLHEKSDGIMDFDYIESPSLKHTKDNVSKENSVEVKVVHILEILSKFSNIDLIKIDVEGSEYEIIPFLIGEKNKIKNVLCELHGNPNKLNYKNPGKIKNQNFHIDYLNLVRSLKEKNLYDNWFYEWY